MGRRKGVVDERTLKMMENYIADRESGLSISQIADKYNLDKRTVHAHLEDIAKIQGVSRESLLDVPHRPHIMSGYNINRPAPKLDTEEFLSQVKTVRDELDKLQTVVRSSLKDCEEFQSAMEV
jgi:predicted DNA-binding protein YlxM (UPF0122 family)